MIDEYHALRKNMEVDQEPSGVLRHRAGWTFPVAMSPMKMSMQSGIWKIKFTKMKQRLREIDVLLDKNCMNHAADN